VRRHDDASVCLPGVQDPSPDLPPTVLQLLAAPHTSLIRLFRAHSQSFCDPNCRSNPIAHRVRRKPQRLPPSLLIENASDRLFPKREVSCPRRFRSRLATTRPEPQLSRRRTPVWTTNGACLIMRFIVHLNLIECLNGEIPRSVAQSPLFISNPGARRRGFVRQVVWVELYCGRPTRRIKSWKRGSERRLSQLGSTLR
jgi:hypothetical protein